MPGRSIPLVTNEIYHIYNRGIDHRPTFINKREFERAIQVIKFYQYDDPPLKLSTFLILSKQKKEIFSEKIEKYEKIVDILSFCFMPNHFHFLLRQTKHNGISSFLSIFQNSYTRYFNLKHKRIGPLFLDQFKAVRIETEEQLLHVSRYIHLNPYTSYVIKNLKTLYSYNWSSLPQLLNPSHELFISKEILLRFNKKLTYEKFLFDQAGYQRNLDKIKHLLNESAYVS